MKSDANQTTVFHDRYFEDVNRGAAAISELGSDIIDMLGNIVQQYPQGSPQARELDSTPFVVCLIDGRQAILLEEQVSKGEIGGREAAERFYSHLMQHLTTQKVFKNDWRLIVKFYANMSQLGTEYLKAGIIDDIGSWRRFIDGFNNAYQFCYFVDLGDDDAGADEKIQNQLEWLFGHNNCRHTVLVGSSERAYAGFLRQYTQPDQLCGSMTMVEAIPFPGEYRELASRFLPQEKKGLFGNRGEDRFTPPSTPTKTGSVTSSTLSDATTVVPKLRPPDSTNSRISRAVIYEDTFMSPVKTPTKSQNVLSSTNVMKAPQTVKRKPLAATQAKTTPVKLSKPKSAFNSNGQRIDSRSYVNVFAQRYLDY